MSLNIILIKLIIQTFRLNLCQTIILQDDDDDRDDDDDDDDDEEPPTKNVVKSLL